MSVVCSESSARRGKGEAMVWSKRSPESGCGRSISTVVSPTVRWTGGITSRLAPMAMRWLSAKRIELRWLRFSMRTWPSSSSATRIWSLETYRSCRTQRGTLSRGGPRPISRGPDRCSISWRSSLFHTRKRSMIVLLSRRFKERFPHCPLSTCAALLPSCSVGPANRQRELPGGTSPPGSVSCRFAGRG